MGDPYYLNDMTTFEAGMLNATYAAIIRSKIDDMRTQNVSAYNPDGFEISDSYASYPLVALDTNIDRHGTSQISTADADMAFSLTTTVNTFFGSLVMVPETGVIMNNQMNGKRAHRQPLQFFTRSPITFPTTFFLPLTCHAEMRLKKTY